MKKSTITFLIFSIFFSLTVIHGQNSLVVTSGTPILDGVVAPGEWTSTPLVTSADITLNAMADGQYVYISASRK